MLVVNVKNKAMLVSLQCSLKLSFCVSTPLKLILDV